MKIYTMCCGRPNACPELTYDKENDLYVLFDEAKGWSSGELFLEDLKTIKKIVTQAIKDAKKRE